MEEISNRDVQHERDGVSRLGQLIKGAKLAVLTTIGHDGRMHSQPATALEAEVDDELYFFVSSTSARADDVRANASVSVIYATAADRRFVAVSGRADVVFDHALMRGLWKPACYASFPLGLDDPDLALLRLRVERAECWDGPSSRVVRLLSFGDDLVVGDNVATITYDTAAANDDLEPEEPAPYQRPWEREHSGRLLLSLEHLHARRHTRLS